MEGPCVGDESGSVGQLGFGRDELVFLRKEFFPFASRGLELLGRFGHGRIKGEHGLFHGDLFVVGNHQGFLQRGHLLGSLRELSSCDGGIGRSVEPNRNALESLETSRKVGCKLSGFLEARAGKGHRPVGLLELFFDGL